MVCEGACECEHVGYEGACVISVQMVVGHQDIEEHRLEVTNSRTSKIEQQRWSGGRKREFDMI